jgi:hypothetical protein
MEAMSFSGREARSASADHIAGPLGPDLVEM